MKEGLVRASAFRPHPLLRGAHAQTIAPALLRPRPRLALRVERLATPDGDFVDLGWAGDAPPGSPLAVLVHGLGGSFESKYQLGLGRQLLTLGWRICVLQLRGAGTQPNRLPRAYHHGDTADLRLLWRTLRAREPHTFIASVGWSLGGNVTLKALGEEGAQAPVDAACAVSVPFGLHECAEHLRHGFARVYQRWLLDALKVMVRRKHTLTPLPAPANFERTMSARDFFEYDDAFTAPLNGYRDAADYYARACCGPFLPRITVPTLILHALDDPFMVPSIVPRASALSPTITLELAERGGHVGFVSADSAGRPLMWAERHLAKHLQARFSASAGLVSEENAAAAAR